MTTRTTLGSAASIWASAPPAEPLPTKAVNTARGGRREREGGRASPKPRRTRGALRNRSGPAEDRSPSGREGTDDRDGQAVSEADDAVPMQEHLPTTIPEKPQEKPTEVVVFSSTPTLDALAKGPASPFVSSVSDSRHAGGPSSGHLERWKTFAPGKAGQAAEESAEERKRETMGKIDSLLDEVKEQMDTLTTNETMPKPAVVLPPLPNIDDTLSKDDPKPLQSKPSISNLNWADLDDDSDSDLPDLSEWGYDANFKKRKSLGGSGLRNASSPVTVVSNVETFNNALNQGAPPERGPKTNTQREEGREKSLMDRLSPRSAPERPFRSPRPSSPSKHTPSRSRSRETGRITATREMADSEPAAAKTTPQRRVLARNDAALARLSGGLFRVGTARAKATTGKTPDNLGN